MRSLFSSGRKAAIRLLVLSLVLLLALPATVAAADDASAYISIRVYDGIDPANMADIESVTREGFVPIISSSDGFLAYYLVFTDSDGLAAVNLFLTAEQAAASNDAARDFVAENLAPLLPNAPRIVEGSIDIGAVNMMQHHWDDLHASVRVYDGYDYSRHEAAVDIVEDGFLPIMLDSDGFYAYYLMSDGDSVLTAISIFDSEQSALDSNAKAADFVAENLTEYLPESPDITSGRAGIAVLDHEALVDEVLDLPPYVSMRVYEGVDPADQAEIVRRTAEGFLPILRASEGFIAYFLLPQDDHLAAVNIFETARQAQASNVAAADFVAEQLAPLLPNPPTVVAGPQEIYSMPALDGEVDSLYGSIRIYQGQDMADQEAMVALTEDQFLPILQAAEGFFGYMAMTDGVSVVGALNIYDTLEHALIANVSAADFVAKHMVDLLPEAPLRIYGTLGIAAIADVKDGVNLIGSMSG